MIILSDPLLIGLSDPLLIILSESLLIVLLNPLLPVLELLLVDLLPPPLRIVGKSYSQETFQHFFFVGGGTMH